MTKVKILTDGEYRGQKFKDAIGKVFDAEVVGNLAYPNGFDGLCYTIGTECEIVTDETAELDYSALAREYGICITTPDGVVCDGRKP